MFSKIHVTKQTLDLLDDQYIYEPGTDKAKQDEFLMKNNIETFLIAPQYYTNPQVSWKYNIEIQEKNNIWFWIPFWQYQYSINDDANRRYSSGVKRIISRTSVGSFD